MMMSMKIDVVATKCKKVSRLRRLSKKPITAKFVLNSIFEENNNKNQNNDSRAVDKSGNGLFSESTKEHTMRKSSSCSNVQNYWNNPNDLVNRLRLLISSSYAGHSGHNNEVISILKELREHDYIV